MKSNTKSSITLPANELKLVIGLMKKLGAKSKVEVIRRGLELLSERTDREALKQLYATASKKVSQDLTVQSELDELSDEGLD
jgi:hypothetical protein